jgi:dephospho-CoA kinase
MKKIVIGLAGEMGSGKGTVAKFIAEKYKGSYYRFSTMLRDVLDRLHLEQSRENLPKISVALRNAFGEDIFDKVMVGDIEKDQSEIIVVDGMRRLKDAENLRKLAGFYLVYVDASLENCFERIVKRHENTDDAGKTIEEFKKEHTDEPETQIRALKDISDFVVENNGTLEELYAKVDEVIKKFYPVK